MKIRLIYSWDKSDTSNMFFMTPASSGIWDGIEFTEKDVENCDGAVILNYPPKDVIRQ